mgnify:CR=1 FL=1
MELKVLCVGRAYVHVFRLLTAHVAQYLGIPSVGEAGVGGENAGAL